MGVTGVQAGARAIIVLLGLSVLRLVMWFASERDSQGEIIAWSDLLFVGCLVPGEVLVVSSRRRHPRFCRDWSSDVCSSDLAMDRARPAIGARSIAALRATYLLGRSRHRGVDLRIRATAADVAGQRLADLLLRGVGRLLQQRRSAERRVGKECTSRWSPDHHK